MGSATNVAEVTKATSVMAKIMPIASITGELQARVRPPVSRMKQAQKMKAQRKEAPEEEWVSKG